MLRMVDVLIMILNPQLVSIDGLSGLLHVGTVRTFMNPNLCYIVDQVPNAEYWQVHYHVITQCVDV